MEAKATKKTSKNPRSKAWAIWGLQATNTWPKSSQRKDLQTIMALTWTTSSFPPAHQNPLPSQCSPSKTFRTKTLPIPSSEHRPWPRWSTDQTSKSFLLFLKEWSPNNTNQSTGKQAFSLLSRKRPGETQNSYPLIRKTRTNKVWNKHMAFINSQSNLSNLILKLLLNS